MLHRRIPLLAAGTFSLCSAAVVAADPQRDEAFAARFQNYCDTFACWEVSGIANPLDLIARAAGGEESALHQIMSGLEDPCDAAGGQGQSDVVGSLLTHVGDRNFARSLKDLSVGQLDAVVRAINYSMLEEGCSLWAHTQIATQFPQTWIALGGSAVPGTDRPAFEPLFPRHDPPADVFEGKEPWLGEFRLADDTTIPASLEITTKGNGALSVGNLVVRVYDDHDDGSVFYGGIADIERCRIRGQAALVIHAHRIYTTSDEFELGTDIPVEVVATFSEGKFEIQHDPFGLVLAR